VPDRVTARRSRVLLPLGLTLGFVLGMDHPAVTQRSDSPTPQARSDSTKAQTRPLTASVLGTFLFRSNEVELLVLWRGAPGWLFASEHTQSSQSANTYNLTYEIGAVRLDLAYDRARRVTKINGMEVAVPRPNNIVMVDEIGSEKRVTTVAAADLSLSGNPELASLLRRSPEAVAFLRCDAVTSHPLQARINALVCDGLKR